MARARASNSTAVTPPFKERARSGMRRRISHGVAYQEGSVRSVFPFYKVAASGTPQGIQARDRDVGQALKLLLAEIVAGPRQ